MAQHRTATCLAVLAIAGMARADGAAPAATWSAGDTSVTDLAFSPDGRQLATFGDDGTAALWDVATHRQVGVLKEVINGRNRVRFTPDGRTLLTLDRNDGLARLSTADGKRLASLPLKSVGGSASGFDVSADGKTVAVVGRGSLRVLSLADGAELQNWTVHENYAIDAVACSPDGKLVATTGTDHKADLVEPTTGKIPLEFATHLNGQFAAFGKDGKQLLVANSDGSLQSLDLASGEVTDLGNAHTTVLAALPAAGGKRVYLATGGHGPAVLTSGNADADTAAFATDALIKSIALSPDGRWIAGGGQDGTVCLWKLSD